MQCILNPERGKSDPLLPANGILAVNPSDVACLTASAQQHKLQRSFLFNSNLYSSEAFFVAGPAVGAPMAVLCLEKLIALGAQKIIIYGWCGSLQEELQVMDVLVPTEALIEEGTSPHYYSSGQQVENTDNTTYAAPSSGLRAALCQCLTEQAIPFQQGKLWTTDAPYRETEAKVEAYQEMGIYGVDMEYSALCTVATYRGVELAAAMLVSDELWRQPWTPNYSFKQFKQRSSKLLNTLCEVVKNIE